MQHVRKSKLIYEYKNSHRQQQNVLEANTYQNKSTQKVAKRLKKKLKYNIMYTTKTTLKIHFTNKFRYNTAGRIQTQM